MRLRTQPPLLTYLLTYWSATTHVGERRNFVRGLVPMSLYTKLTTPPSGQRKPAHCHCSKLALMAQVPLLLNALHRTLEWLNDNPPQPHSPPPRAPTHGDAPGRLTARHTPPNSAPPPPTTPPPPSRTTLHTSLQSAPVPHPLRHTPKL